MSAFVYTPELGVEDYMTEKKTVLVSFRATPTFKQALKLAADHEKRSQANFLDKLVLDYCELRGLALRQVSRGEKRAKDSSAPPSIAPRSGKVGR